MSRGRTLVGIGVLVVAASIGVAFAVTRDGASSPDDGAVVVRVPSERDAQIDGKLRYDGVVPDGGEFRVELLDGHGDVVNAVVAVNPGASPIDFAVPYVAQDLNDHLVRASLVSAAQEVVVISDPVAARTDGGALELFLVVPAS